MKECNGLTIKKSRITQLLFFLRQGNVVQCGKNKLTLNKKAKVRSKNNPATLNNFKALWNKEYPKELLEVTGALVAAAGNHEEFVVTEDWK